MSIEEKNQPPIDLPRGDAKWAESVSQVSIAQSHVEQSMQHFDNQTTPGTVVGEGLAAYSGVDDDLQQQYLAEQRLKSIERRQRIGHLVGRLLHIPRR